VVGRSVESVGPDDLRFDGIKACVRLHRGSAERAKGYDLEHYRTGEGLPSGDVSAAGFLECTRGGLANWALKRTVEMEVGIDYPVKSKPIPMAMHNTLRV
jgi:hypothetical protein